MQGGSAGRGRRGSAGREKRGGESGKDIQRVYVNMHVSGEWLIFLLVDSEALPLCWTIIRMSISLCEPCVQHEPSCNMMDCARFPDPVSKEQIVELKIKYPSSASGCEWQGQLGAVVSHRGFYELKHGSHTCSYTSLLCSTKQ